jgi:hypothetical protein
VVPPLREVIPDRRPDKDPGRQADPQEAHPSTQREQVGHYWGFVSGHIVMTVQEAFAVAPGLGTARVAVLRHEERERLTSRGVVLQEGQALI